MRAMIKLLTLVFFIWMVSALRTRSLIAVVQEREVFQVHVIKMATNNLQEQHYRKKVERCCNDEANRSRVGKEGDVVKCDKIRVKIIVNNGCHDSYESLQ